MDIPDVPPPLPPPDVSLPLPSPDIPLPLPSPGLPLEWGKPNDVSGSTFIERAVQPGSSLHGRVEGKRSRLDEQPELPHRGGFTSTIEHDNAGASTDPEIRTNLVPIDEGYASFAPNGIVSDRPKSEAATPAGLGFQNSVQERFRTHAQAYDKSLLEKLAAGRGADYAPPRSSYLPFPRRTDGLYPRSLLSLWTETDPVSFQINDNLTEPLHNVAGQKRRASSPPPLSDIFDSPWLPPENEPKFEPSAFDPFEPSPAGSIALKNRYQPSLERQPLEPSRETTKVSRHSTLNYSPSTSNFCGERKIPGFYYLCECCPMKPEKFETQAELNAHEQEKPYECAHCRNRFKNENEVEPHLKAIHLRWYSWSCSALSGYSDAFQYYPKKSNETDTCGYCGEDFPRSGSGLGVPIATEQDWEVRIRHLQEIHRFGECNYAKKFWRRNHFGQHLKHSHSATSGKWRKLLENACMRDEHLLDLPMAWSKGRYSDSPRYMKLSSAPQETVDDTDTKTCLSKDSGYYSMISRAQRPIPGDGQGISDSAKWETGSVASVQSWATRDTMSSVNPAAAGGAADELAEMLVKDDLISGLIVDGYKNFGSERFERNLRRILKKFALSLRREARNELEKSAIHLVHNYRAYIIILIRKRLELAEDERATSLDELQKQKQSKLALERFLGLIPSAEEDGEEDRVEENECGSDIDSDLSDSELPNLRNLEKVKLYLLSSTAFSELKQQLTDFVRPSNRTTVLGVDESLPVGLDTGHDEAEVGVENCVTEEYGIPAPKPEEDCLQFGSSSIRASEFTWRSVLKMPLNGRSGSLQECDPGSLLEPGSQEISKEQHSLEETSKIGCPQQSTKHQVQLPIHKEEVHLESWEPKHGWLEEAVLSMRPWIAMSLQCSPRQLLKLRNWWARSRRKPVAKDCSRIEWTCACGHDLFADFNTKSQDALDKYAAILKYTPDGNSQSSTSQPPMTALTSPPTAHFQHPNVSNSPRQTAHDPSNLTPASTLQTLSMTTNNGLDLSFLELCVNTGPHLKSLAEIDTANISTDGTLFQALRKQYLRLRGFRSRFWLLKPAAISFVRFSLENRHRVGILQKPLALPPKSEVDAKNWIYDPCPLDGDPPIAEDLFLHYLQCSEGPGTLFWMLRFPRKLETSLLKSAALASFGWGIHIDEGPDFAALFKANFVVVLLSGIVAGLWSLFEHDFQGAFGFACWIIAVLNSLLMAYMFKWRQE